MRAGNAKRIQFFDHSFNHTLEIRFCGRFKMVLDHIHGCVSEHTGRISVFIKIELTAVGLRKASIDAEHFQRLCVDR